LGYLIRVYEILISHVYAYTQQDLNHFKSQDLRTTYEKALNTVVKCQSPVPQFEHAKQVYEQPVVTLQPSGIFKTEYKTVSNHLIEAPKNVRSLPL